MYQKQEIGTLGGELMGGAPPSSQATLGKELASPTGHRGLVSAQLAHVPPRTGSLGSLTPAVRSAKGRGEAGGMGGGGGKSGAVNLNLVH